jgi:hypothetical protein
LVIVGFASVFCEIENAEKMTARGLDHLRNLGDGQIMTRDMPEAALAVEDMIRLSHCDGWWLLWKL